MENDITQRNKSIKNDSKLALIFAVPVMFGSQLLCGPANKMAFTGPQPGTYGSYCR